MKVVSVKGVCGIHKSGDSCTFTDTATHACPDAANPVVFEITRTYGS